MSPRAACIRIRIVMNVAPTHFIKKYSVMHGKTEIDVDEWFTKAATGNRATRTATGALNVRQKHGCLNTRKYFFTVRSTANWNSVPSEIKQAKSASSFKVAYAKYREQSINP